MCVCVCVWEGRVELDCLVIYVGFPHLLQIFFLFFLPFLSLDCAIVSLVILWAQALFLVALFLCERRCDI